MGDLQQALVATPENRSIVQLVGFHEELPTDFGAVGTGIVISSHYLLTAAHNLFVFESNPALSLPVESQVDRLLVLFERDGGNVGQSVALSVADDRITYLRGYDAAGERTDDLDLALIRLDDPVPTSTADIYGLAAYSDTADLTGIEIRIAGYIRIRFRSQARMVAPCSTAWDPLRTTQSFNSSMTTLSRPQA